GSVVLVGRVEEDPRPCKYKAVVRLRYIKDHLVLARDLVQPGLELRIGAGARHPSRLRRTLDGRDEAAQTHGGGARGEAAQESAATASELLLADPPVGRGMEGHRG